MGISIELTILGTPLQNGVVEKRNKMLLNMIRSTMTLENISISY